MGRTLKGIGGIALFLSGWIVKILDLIGRGEVAVNLPDSLNAIAGFLARNQEVGWQALPWVLMLASTYFLAGLQWPVLFFRRRAPANTVERAAVEVTDKWTWPALTKTEVDAMYLALKGSGGAHSIQIACDNRDCSNLADSIQILFRRLGWPCHIGSGLFDAHGVEGLLLTPDNDTSRLLKDTIEKHTSLTIEILHRAKDSGSSAKVMLIIGSRAPIEQTTYHGKELQARREGSNSAYWTPYEVVHYIADEYLWGSALRDKNARQTGTRKHLLLETFPEFQSAAQSGMVRVLGRLNGVGVHQEIPPSFWLTSSLDIQSALSHQSSRTSPSVAKRDGIPTYYDLRISTDDVRKYWPEDTAHVMATKLYGAPEPQTTDSIEELMAEAHLAHGFDADSKETREKGVLLLARLRSVGVKLRDDAVSVVDTGVNDWVDKSLSWLRQTSEAIEIVSAADAEIFATLDTVPNARVNFPVNVVDPELTELFVSRFRQHDLRLARLGDLLQRYRNQDRG